MFELQNSGNNRSSGEIGLNIKTHAGPGVKRSERPLLECRIHCKCSIRTYLATTVRFKCTVSIWKRYKVFSILESRKTIRLVEDWGLVSSEDIVTRAVIMSLLPCKDKKEEIWATPMTKAPTPTEMSKGQSDNTNNATKKFDKTAIADRLRTVSWSNYSHPTGVVNLVYGSTFPLPATSV